MGRERRFGTRDSGGSCDAEGLLGRVWEYLGGAFCRRPDLGGRMAVRRCMFWTGALGPLFRFVCGTAET